MPFINKHITALIPIAFFAITTPVLAQTTQDTPVNITQEENAQQRINLSGKLRMLSQRIPSSACHLHRNIASDAAGPLLAAATAEFDQILAALEFGDSALDIVHPEEQRKALERIHQLRDVWEPFKAAAMAVSAGGDTDTELHYLLTENLAVLAAAQLLVEQLVREYANPNAATQASLMLIDISGRQRMLTQKISKETCVIGTIHETDETVSNLTGTTQIFEASLEALRFGMPAVGIGPPPNSQISDGLQIVLNDWSSVKPILEQVIQKEPLSFDALATKFNDLNHTMADMNSVVGLYTKAAGPNT